MEKQISEVKKRRFKFLFQIVFIAFVVAAAGFSGFFAGNWYITKNIAKANYDFTEETLRDDVATIRSEVQKIPFSEVSAVQAFVIAEDNYLKKDKWLVVAEGGVTHNFGNQTVYDYRYLKDGVCYSENISKSALLSVAKKCIMVGATIKVYDGTVKSSNSAQWAEDFVTLSADEYKDKSGTLPNSVIPYIVSSKTVTSSTTGNLVGVGVYEYTIELTADSSVLNYVKEIKNMSDLKDYPTFNKISLVFRVNSDFDFVSVTSIETYQMNYFGVAVTCNGTLARQFDYNTIPQDRIL